MTEESGNKKILEGEKEVHISQAKFKMYRNNPV